MKSLLTKETVSDFLIKRLYDWGIRRIYGYPGNLINRIMGALISNQRKIDFIQTRHEEMAALFKDGPQVWEIIKQSFKKMVQDYLPHDNKNGGKNSENGKQ
jgi:hypothetical protein